MTNGTGKNIYLSGGGDEHASYSLDRFFFRDIPEKGRILYVPVALRNSKFFSGAESWFRGVMNLHDRQQDTVLEVWSELEGRDFSDLGRFDAIYIGGGNTWSLMKEISESGFKEFLQRYIENGGMYYGGSAGAIILGKRINTHDDENKVGLSAMEGLGLLGGYAVACHFKDEQQGRFKVWAIKNMVPILCLPEETGLIVKNGSARCMGEKSCIVYGADGTKTEVDPEESFPI